MTIVSGDSALVDVEGSPTSTVRGWSIDYTGPPVPYAASNTKLARTRLAGNKDWTGSYKAYGHTPAVKPGEKFLFEGSIDGTNGAKSDASGTICLNVVIGWDVEAGAIIQHEVFFAANGPLTLGAVTATADATVPDAPTSIGVKIERASAVVGPVFSAIPDIRAFSLTISREGPSYVSTDTSGETKREPGNWDVKLDYTQYQGDSAKWTAPGTVKHLKLYVDATTFWELQWMRFGELGGVEINREDPNIVSVSQMAEMEGFTDVGGSATAGKIEAPGAASWWSGS